MTVARAWRHAVAAVGAVAVCSGCAPAQARQLPVPTDPADVSGLPVIEVPAAAGTAMTPRTLAVFLTGDGGWATLDRVVAAALAKSGVHVVGLNCRAYLSARRTPDDVGRDVARMIRHYERTWGTRRVVLAGYSRGAEMLPFAATRLPADLRANVALVAMLGLATSANFEFHWIDMVKTVRRKSDLPIPPELAKLRGTRMLCVYGAEEDDSGCRAADSTLVVKVRRPGGHHFDGDYQALAALILSRLPVETGRK